MFLTISTTASPTGPLIEATDLGYLLHKHPERLQTSTLPVGRAHVFYPEATAARCTVALLLEVDPVGIVRTKRFHKSESFTLAQYVNDRSYAASSMLAVALGKVFATARSGRCEARPDLPAQVLDLHIHVPAMPCRGGAAVARRFLEPLGWQVEARPVPLDPTIPSWGDSRYLDLHLSGEMRLADALNQLYVLLPVFDDAKHYWVGHDEVDKLVRVGGSWLADHPAREEISQRYLAHRRQYVDDAVARLDALDELPDSDGTADQEDALSAPRVSLAAARADAVLEELRAHAVTSVVDLGCGEGALLRRLAAVAALTSILGADVSARAVQRAADRLNLREASDAQRDRLRLIQTSLTYTDDRLTGFDAGVLMEVIEHIDPSRLDALAQVVWGHARPRIVLVTTPNAEFNVHYRNLFHDTDGPGAAFRHRDHRFEWTRAQFSAWARAVGERFGYSVTVRDVGDPAVPAQSPAPQCIDVGAPTQMAIFTREPGEPNGDFS